MKGKIYREKFTTYLPLPFIVTTIQLLDDECQSSSMWETF